MKLLSLYILFLEPPHIFASFFGFFDKEYVQHHRRQLFIFIPILLACFSALLYLHFEAALTIYLVATVWHVVKQQTGIALLLGARPDFLQKLWAWIPVLAIGYAYITRATTNGFAIGYALLLLSGEHYVET